MSLVIEESQHSVSPPAAKRQTNNPQQLGTGEGFFITEVADSSAIHKNGVSPVHFKLISAVSISIHNFRLVLLLLLSAAEFFSHPL